MSQRCANPIPWEVLVDYWADDLPPARAEEVEEHVLGCGSCAAESARVAAVTETLRGVLAPIVTRDAVAGLVAKGTRIRENVISPGERREIAFPKDVDLLLHRLVGLDLRDAERIEFVLREESTGAVVASMDPAPFDRDAGAVLVACARHNIHFPHDTVAELAIHASHGPSPRRVSYTILHRYG
jgi:anti-sigma factor RsiW